METYLILAVLAYLSYAFSTSIDKIMMNRRYDVLYTSILKTLFDGIILVAMGLFLLKIIITIKLIAWSLIIGVILSAIWILYYSSLKAQKVGEVIPLFQSSYIVLVFISSIIIFNETVADINYLGIVFVILGVYIAAAKKISIPRFGHATKLIIAMSFLELLNSIVTKWVLFDQDALSLAIMTYFSTTLIIGVYYFAIQKKKTLTINIKGYGTIGAAALFGSMGTYLLFTALSIGPASKIFSLSGLHSVIVVLIAGIALREELTLRKAVGALLVFIGIFLITQ